MDANQAAEVAEFLEFMTEARRAVALAKVTEFYEQAKRISAGLPEHRRSQAAAALMEIAVANDLVELHGEDLIQGIMAQGFVDGRR